MKTTCVLGAIAMLAVTAIGCSFDAIGTGEIADGLSAGEQACLDMADRIAKSESRCINQKAYDVFRQRYMDLIGGCEGVIVRDPAALYEVCFPSLAKTPCTDWTTGQSLDESCVNQFTH